MKILNLKISNFKKIVNVEITPTDNVVKISGKNGAGKSSVLDAFWVALGGTKNAPDQPIREGQALATIKLDLGDITVERRFSAGGKSVLFVTNEVGAKIKAPQKVLDDLLGRLSFDPLQFMRMGAKEQVTYLKELVGLDFTDMDAERSVLFDKRTQAKRTLADIESQHEAIDIHEDTPEETLNVADLVGDLQTATETNATLTRYVSRGSEIDVLLLDLQSKIELLKSERDAIIAYCGNNTEIDLQPIRDKIANIELLNGYRRDMDTRDGLGLRIAKGREVIATMTENIEAVDEDKRNQLAASTFPLEGLGFDAEAVTFNGLPITQASYAEQLKISTSMAMALNPDLRVIRITDGSMLDADSMKVIENIAEKNDFQVWVEIVDDTGEIGVYIQDGVVVANNKESAA